MPLPFLRRPSRDPAIPRSVTVYSKPGCHLCEDALALLHGLQREWTLHIAEIDISGDAGLMRKYGVRIPVIVVDGRIELKAPITEKAIRKALR
jgi:glutaredoxin